MKINNGFSKCFNNLVRGYHRQMNENSPRQRKQLFDFGIEYDEKKDDWLKEKKEFNIDSIKKYLQKKEKAPQKLQKSTTRDYVERTMKSIQSMKRLKEMIEEKGASLCKYDPNYKAISKNIPRIDFSKDTPRERSLEKENQNHPKSDRLPRLDFFYMQKRESDNHAFRFSKYTSRERKKSESSPLNKSGSQSHSSKKNLHKNKSQPNLRHKGAKIKTLVDYNHRDFHHKQKITNTPIPTIGMYTPQYKYVFPSSPYVKFSPSSEQRYNKKFLLQKLWKSYILTPDYKLVNL